MMKIKELKMGDSAELFCRINAVEFRTTAKGKLYADFALSDKTGSVKAKKWQATMADQEVLKVGLVLKVTGKADQYMGKVQIIMDNYQIIDLDPDDFAVSAIGENPVKKMQDLFDCIADEDYKKLISMQMSDPEMQEHFNDWPAAAACHHAEKHGLLWHTLSVMEMCHAVAKRRNFFEDKPVVNEDLLLTAAFFHDIGKLHEMEPNEVGAGKYTAEGTLFGHIYMGAEKVHDLCREAGCPAEKEDLLKHCILAHHGELEYGSPVKPAIVEAEILHNCDNMDAKIFAMETEMIPLNAGEISANVNYCLGTRAFRAK